MNDSYDKWQKRRAIEDFMRDPTGQHGGGGLLHLFIAFPKLLLWILILGGGFVLFSLIVAPTHTSAPVSGSAPDAAPVTSAPDAASPASSTGPAAAPRTVDHLGQLNSDADVLDLKGRVIATVHSGHFIHILALLSDGRMKIRLHDGDEGWIAANAADDVGDWAGSAPERNGSP